MKTNIQIGLALGILVLLAQQAGFAQGNSAGPTMYQAQQGGSAGATQQAGQGQTNPTMTQGANSGLNLPKVQTGVLAPQSVSGAPIPSGQYTFGFPGGQGQPYSGPYKSGGSGGGGGFSVGTNLPPTSTSSCLPITILDDEAGTSAGGSVGGSGDAAGGNSMSGGGGNSISGGGGNSISGGGGAGGGGSPF